PDQDEVDQVRIAFRAPAVPGLGVAALTAGPPVPLPRGGDVRVSGRALENRFVQVALERNGALTLHDRRRNERYGDLLRLEDGGDAGDAYSYCPPVRDRIKPSRGPIAVRRLAGGPLVAALEARWEVVRGVDARLVVQLFADSPIVRVTLDVDNRNRYHRLRARLMTGLGGVPATAGDIERGDVLPQLWEDAFLPLHGLWLRDAAAPLTITPVSIALEGSGLVYTALKPAQIASPTVLRCYNATSRKAAGAWR